MAALGTFRSCGGSLAGDIVCAPSTSCSVGPRIVCLGRVRSRFGAEVTPVRLSLAEHRRLVVAHTASVDLGPDDDGGDEGDDTPSRQQRGRSSKDKGRAQPKVDDGTRVDAEGFSERVLQVSRVTKVVKGGKQMSFRAVVVVGNTEGQVGVGCASAKEVVTAVEKASHDAKRHLITVPIIRGYTFPHRIDGIACGAKVMLRPACEGTGVIAGGAVREVLELAGVRNAFGKQLGSANPLNNARATIDGLSRLRTLSQAAANRDLTVEEMLGHRKDQAVAAA